MVKRSVVRITKRVVDDLGAGGTIWDAELKGFGVRCQARGKVYVLKTTVQGTQRWLTIGKHGSPWTPEGARAKALQLLGEIVQGIDPRVSINPTQVRLRELCQRYLELYAIPRKKASSVKLDRMNLRNHVIPLLGQKYVDQLSTNDIETFKIAVASGKTAPKDIKAQTKLQGGGIVVRGGQGVANRTLTLLSTILTLAEKWHLRPRGTNPVKDVARFREKPKERFLTKDELQRLAATLDQRERDESESIYAIAAIRLLIFTGARLSEVLTLKWDYVQLEHSQLRLPDSKTGAKSISLNEAARELLNQLPRHADNPFVILGRRHERHLIDLQRPWQRIRTAAGLQDVRIHDLRHSFAALAIQAGVPLGAIGKLLGHRSSQTTQRYVHYEKTYIDEENEKIGRLLVAFRADKGEAPAS